ncbi:hypothetical protein CTAYLR_003429 [Chrysophaeum taylorii]|uniref:Uncharacterized protein n=1 Tax=Chrysophaeum taylorii TaxID=2483200 RepID=A0AAD7U7K7_9STRA|nr:hypothetical protein CTAYLR_003429 [Chrysophaeum taylorii]
MPGLIQEKLAHNPKLNTAQLVFNTHLPDDAFDFLLDMRPDLKPLVSDLVTDELALELKSMRKDDVSPEALEEIQIDMRWRAMATISGGLLLAGPFLRLPEVLQETICGEIVMFEPALAPLGVFSVVARLRVDDHVAWNSGMLALATIIISGLLVYLCARFFETVQGAGRLACRSGLLAK